MVHSCKCWSCAVVLACRDINKGKIIKHEFIQELKCSTSCQKRVCSSRIEVMELDVSSFQSIRAFGAAWEKRRSPVHILINNAGIFSMSAPRTETCDGFESHIGTNYLGHFLLTMLLQPSLLQAGRQMKKPARVVNVSSRLNLMGRINTSDPNMKKHFSSLEAYAQSKLAQVIFAKEFTNRMQGAIRCISLHPGEVLTDVVRSLPPIMQIMYKWFMGIFLLTPSQGARSSVYAATSHDLDSQSLKEIFYIDSDCRPSKANPEAYSEKIAEWLWQWSCECMGL